MADNKQTVTQRGDEERSSTTVELPAELHVRAKVAVAQNKAESLRQLIVEGLELRLAQIEKQEEK